MFYSLAGDFLVLVEYCRFGNLRTFLRDHRDNYLNLLDAFGNWNQMQRRRQQHTFDADYSLQHQESE